MRHLICVAVFTLGLIIPARAVIITESYTFNSGFENGGNLPDGDPSGLADVRNIDAFTSINSITDITVGLEISGTWNGDIYATLQHGSGFSVLLNRVGRTSNSGLGAFGSSDDGFNILLNDSVANPDIHVATSGVGPLIGTFGTDGREVDPDSVLDTDARTALLDSFFGLSVLGDWTLFIADLSGGDTHTLNSWSMEITGDTAVVGVPDGGASVFLFLFALGAMCLVRVNKTVRHAANL